MAEFAPSAHDDYDFSAEVAADEEAFRREVEAASRDAGEDETVAPDDDGAPSTGPIVTLLIGMAGSGKTTLFHRLHYDCASSGRRCYFVNLDPAVLEVPIEPQIDIRDTVDYKGVMREYKLGPNGAIVTSLNLFATQFAEVMKILEKRAADFDHVIVDTPGQIEAFTWSASGQLIAESLASTFATNIVYVVDTPRTMGPSTFMSNMVYACSILHKLRLPLTAAFNKVDVQPCEACFEWMDDFENLVLDEFYRVLARVGVSAVSGAGIDALFDKITASRAIYDATYGAEINRRLAAAQAAREAKAAADLVRLEKDVADVAKEQAAKGPN
ncbi:GTPase [Aureococcus anophagefferens]|nr:GTPase [Aureococcus anophagefferens]